MIFEKLRLQMKVKLKRRKGEVGGRVGGGQGRVTPEKQFVIPVSDASSAKASFREIYFKTEDLRI